MTFAAGLLDSRGPRYAVAHEGVVVAVTDLYDGIASAGATLDPQFAMAPTDAFDRTADDPEWYSASTIRVLDGSVTLAVCAPGSATPGVDPLPAGDYELYALLDVTVIGDDAADPPLPTDWAEMAGEKARAELPLDATSPGTAIGAPVPFTVVGTSAGPTPEPSSETSTLAVPTAAPALCHDDAPVPAGEQYGLRLDSAQDPVALAGQSPLAVEARFRYVGPGRLVTHAELAVGYTVVRAGVVVGRGSDLTHGGELTLDLGTGSSFAVSASAPLEACAQGDDAYALDGPLRPGVYTVYPTLAVRPERVVTPDTVLTGPDSQGLGADSPVELVGAPFEVTVTG
jgi:hypothetical protein